MAMISGRPTKERQGREFVFPITSGVEITLGTMVAIDAGGNAVPASATAGLTVVGVAWDFQGADSLYVTARRGCFNFDAATADTPTIADIGKPVYAADAESVANADTGNRPQAGILLGIDVDGCWVRF